MTIERMHSRIIRNKPTLLHIDEAQRMLTPSGSPSTAARRSR